MILGHSVARSVLKVVARVVHATGLVRLAIVLRRRLLRSYGVYILSYHHVIKNAHPENGGDETTTAQLEQHLRWLTSRFQLVSLSQALELLARRRLDRDYVVITFDDGYEDNYMEAFPLLRQFHVPATIFLITRLVGTDQVPWYDEYRVRLSSAASPIALDSRRECSGFRVLNWRQVHEMAGQNIEFGSHTANHHSLTRLDPQVRMHELESSKASIEQELQRPCLAFAYPNGEFDAAAMDAVARAGYQCACTQRFGANKPRCNPFGLRRVALGNTEPTVVALKLSGLATALFAVRDMWSRARRSFAAAGRGLSGAGRNGRGHADSANL